MAVLEFKTYRLLTPNAGVYPIDFLINFFGQFTGCFLVKFLQSGKLPISLAVVLQEYRIF